MIEYDSATAYMVVRNDAGHVGLSGPVRNASAIDLNMIDERVERLSAQNADLRARLATLEDSHNTLLQFLEPLGELQWRSGICCHHEANGVSSVRITDCQSPRVSERTTPPLG